MTVKPARTTNLGVAVILAITGLLAVSVWIAFLSGRAALILPVWHQYLGHSVDPTLARTLLALATILVYLAGCRVFYPRAAWLLVGWSVIGGVAIRLAVLALAGEPLPLLFACSTGGCAGGWALGLKLTPEMLHQWPELMPSFLVKYPHQSVSAAGWPMLYAGLIQALEHAPALSNTLSTLLRPLQCASWDFNSLSDAQVAGAWLGITAPFWSALTAVPLYIYGRMIGGKRTASAALVWLPLIPAAALFATSPSPTYALPAVTVAALLWGGMIARARGRAALLLLLAGALMGAALVVNLSLALLLPFCGLLILLRAAQESWPQVGPVLRRTVTVGLLFGFGLLAVWGAYGLLTEHSMFSVIRVALGIDQGLSLELSFLGNIGLSAWDFVLFTGLPLCGLAFAVAFSKRRSGETALVAALGGALLVFFISGMARFEIARSWAFFMPFVALVGATAYVQLRPAVRWALLAGQVILLLTIATTFTPQFTQARWVPNYDEVAAAPLPTSVMPVDATFGDALRLTGYQVEHQPGTKALTLALHWQALRQTDLPYYFSAVLVSPDGEVLPGVDWQPLGKQYPTSCWPPGRPVVDQIELPLGADAAVGDWWLSLRAFGIRGDQSLPPLEVTLPDGTTDTQLGLGSLQVKE